MAGEKARSFPDYVDNRFGRRIYLDPADPRARRLAASAGNPEPEALALWQRALALVEWSAVVDVGCGYGEMLAGVDLPDGAEVVAFEPATRILPRLEKTLGGLDRPVDLVPTAVADRPRESAQLVIEPDSGRTHLARRDEDEPHIAEDVEVTSLDASLADRDWPSACLRVDVEGGELAVFKGAHRALGSLERWAMVIQIRHMDPLDVAELAESAPAYVLDPRYGSLIRLSGSNRALVEEVLASGWVYADDALLLSSPELAEGSVNSAEDLCQAAASREADLAELEERLAPAHAAGWIRDTVRHLTPTTRRSGHKP